MKLRSLEEEVLCMTYTKDACAELEKIRRKMLTKMNSVRCEVLKYRMRCIIEIIMKGLGLRLGQWHNIGLPPPWGRGVDISKTTKFRLILAFFEHRVLSFV